MSCLNCFCRPNAARQSKKQILKIHLRLRVNFILNKTSVFLFLFAIMKKRRRFFYNLFAKRHRKLINKKKWQQIVRNFKSCKCVIIIFMMHVIENCSSNIKAHASKNKKDPIFKKWTVKFCSSKQKNKKLLL